MVWYSTRRYTCRPMLAALHLAARDQRREDAFKISIGVRDQGKFGMVNRRRNS